MKPIEVRVYRFRPADMDFVTVYVEEHSESFSRITIQCNEWAWTRGWGGHDNQKIEQLICNTDAEFVTDSLMFGLRVFLLKRHVKSRRKYLLQIVHGIQRHWAEIEKENTDKKEKE